MFKKLKDKLAEEVKSSPQRIQLFAQAAQAAVTSASSSISDITNSDLFTIGDNDTQQPRQIKSPSSPAAPHKMFQDVSLIQSLPTESSDFTQEIGDGQRQRRLSNSSFASDISFRLPSYENPSMYHLQSDMEVSASEADDRGFSGGAVTLDRVTKEQLYAAYKRTQERYKKYRSQYGDLARHYKLLERENAKARSVLVETQDKALRRISELKEQCSLEQSAKAHLEKALRVDIEEKNAKIEALYTKLHFLQNNTPDIIDNGNEDITEKDVQLINLNNESNSKIEDSGAETSNLSNKIEKMEQLLSKYKESLKTSKEKNAQLTTELQIVSKELENKEKLIQDLKASEGQLSEARTKIKELININEELQNQINSFEFKKTKEQSTLELDLQKANDEVADLCSKIEVFTKREEEYAISLAENKLSIHKELESKEAEIKSLKYDVSAGKIEIQSLKIVVDDYKNNILILEEEKNKLSNDCTELITLKNKISEMEQKMEEITKKSQLLEQFKAKADEEYKCLQLQLKQETAEKLAMIDRNAYLETKNSQLGDENAKKNTKISGLESQLQVLSSNKDHKNNDLAVAESEKCQLLDEINLWKNKCNKLEQEIQEEREELVNLQTEIEKLLSNHELIQKQNVEFRSKIANLTSEYSKEQESVKHYKTSIESAIRHVLEDFKQVKEYISAVSHESTKIIQTNKEDLFSMSNNINNTFTVSIHNLLKDIETVTTKYNNLKLDYDKLQTTIVLSHSEKTENFNKYDVLQKENDNLRIELENNESNIKSINEVLENMTREYNNVKSLGDINKELIKKVNEIEGTSHLIQSKLDSEKVQHSATAEKLKLSELDKHDLNGTIQTLESKNQSFIVEIEEIKQNHRRVLDETKIRNDEILMKKEEAIKKLSLEEQHHLDLGQKIQQLETEKDKLNELLKKLENKNITLQSNIEALNIRHEKAVATINELNIEISNKAFTLEKSKQEQISLEKKVDQYAILNRLIPELEHVKQDLTVKLDLMEEKNKRLTIELEETNSKLESAEARIQEVSTSLTNKSNECDINKAHINDLDKQINKLTQENISLTSKTANFASNIKNLESEIENIKISHTEIENEKDRLNKIIEELIGKQDEIKNLKNDMDTQTESHDDNKVVKEETATILENKWIMEHKQTMSSTASLNLNKENVEDLYEQYSTLKMNYDLLKDENRRLQSDIEGLQSYLTKISKENSVLNDKLRELIATSEHSTDNDQLSSDVKELRNEVQISKEKINDLQRENSLLIEENLELKDQLHSLNYPTPIDSTNVSSNDKELGVVMVKYNDLLQASTNLEKENMDLKQINKSVNGNMQQLQEKNERLKLSNEKFERRLDEALVSLRHLHSLQENTELEYLRNILYEYLTGSGIHSVTLAKVLAAIVKFDDGQTELVLQKEKERQGFLRQLGII